MKKLNLISFFSIIIIVFNSCVAVQKVSPSSINNDNRESSYLTDTLQLKNGLIKTGLLKTVFLSKKITFCEGYLSNLDCKSYDGNDVDFVINNLESFYKLKKNKNDISQTIFYMSISDKKGNLKIGELQYSGNNYDFYALRDSQLSQNANEITKIIVTRPGERKELTSYNMKNQTINHYQRMKVYLTSSKNRFKNCTEIESALKEKMYKQDKFNPYTVIDKCSVTN
jgi:hypothetical protein